MAKASKRMCNLNEKIEADRNYSLDEAVELVKACAVAKFDETLDVAINLGVNPRHADQMVRGMCQLPKGTGRQVRVAVFAKGDKAQEARQAGADIVGAEDLAEEIRAGKIDFDRAIATPDVMAIVGGLGRILGPRGLMPNPRVGTVTNDIGQAVRDSKGGAVEFRVEKGGIIHAGVGKTSFNNQDLIDNVNALIEAIRQAKPSGAKGNYLKCLSLSSTMGPGVRVDVSSLA